jgi:hypothetical protein
MATGRIIEILGEAKKLAREYRALSGKPLGITGEVAEHEAAVHLGVELAVAREAGYDATEVRDGVHRRLQIKGRCVLEDSKRGQRLGSIDVTKQWDAVLLVLLDSNFDATQIFEAERAAVVAALEAPGSRARNERGALSVSKFRAIGTLRWKRPTPITLEQMDELLSFLPVFDSPGPETEPRWSRLDQKPTDGVFVMPYPKYPPVVHEFFVLAAQEWWNDPSYASSGASDQVGNDSAIAAASLSQIRSMLTFCTRGERFCDGHWAEMVKTGRIGAILRRLEHLRREAADARQNAAAQVGHGTV